MISLKSKPSVTLSSSSLVEYINPTDRFFKPIPKRYTTTNVENAVKLYCDVSLKGLNIVKNILQELCDILIKDMFIVLIAIKNIKQFIIYVKIYKNTKHI
jgi:hypothetical protein